MYWQSTVSSRLTHKERGIHTRFSVFILGVQFHCMLLVATKKRTRSGHHQYNKMQLSGGNSTCKVVKKIIRSLNRTNRPNRPNRQTCKGSLSIMRCNFRMENPICQIEHNISHSSNRTKGNSSCRVVNKIVHSPNRTNRLNRQT